jgi:hypothetical protein
MDQALAQLRLAEDNGLQEMTWSTLAVLGNLQSKQHFSLVLQLLLVGKGIGHLEDELKARGNGGQVPHGTN